jgi:predicted dehydrogenase
MANRVHYPSLASFEDVELAAVADLLPDRLAATADAYGIEKRYADYRQMIEDVAPDAVFAIGPPLVMYDIWVWCLQRGLNLFIEKPMGITGHQARVLAYLADKHGCVTQVGFQRRASPLAVKLRDECLRRGSIVHAVCRFYKCDISPFLNPLGHVMDDGVHAIDTLRWMCGGEVVEIRSTARCVMAPDINFVSAILQFDNGATGLLINNWLSGRRVFAVEMHAPGIAVEADLEGQGYIYADGDTDGIAYDARAVAGSEESFVFGGFRAKSREFIDAVKSGGLPGSHFADALKTIEVAEKILAAAAIDGA